MRTAALIVALLLAAAPAVADGLACPAQTVCRNNACAPARGDAGARLMPMGTGMAALGLASDGPPLAVTRSASGSGAEAMVRFATADGGERLVVRAADLAFTYVRRVPGGTLSFRGTCTEE